LRSYAAGSISPFVADFRYLDSLRETTFTLATLLNSAILSASKSLKTFVQEARQRIWMVGMITGT
jgi:hypothetical protein